MRCRTRIAGILKRKITLAFGYRSGGFNWTQCQAPGLPPKCRSTFRSSAACGEQQSAHGIPRRNQPRDREATEGPARRADNMAGQNTVTANTTAEVSTINWDLAA
jgi:hypothetical protein